MLDVRTCWSPSFPINPVGGSGRRWSIATSRPFLSATPVASYEASPLLPLKICENEHPRVVLPAPTDNV